MNKALWTAFAILYSLMNNVSGQLFTDVKIVYPEDTINISLSDREVRKIERKTRQIIEEFACDHIIFDNSKSYALDSAQEYYDLEFINSINRIPKNLHRDMVTICGMGIDRKGWNVGIEAGYGNNRIVDNNISALTIESDAHAWIITSGPTPHLSTSAYYYFNDQLALKSGLGFQSFNSTYSLNGVFTDQSISTDVNLDSYYKTITAEYDSSLSLSQLTIPIAVNFSSGKPWQFGIFIETGLVFAINLKREYQVSGNYRMCGYYPEHNPVTSMLCFEELGFYTEEGIERSSKAPVSTLNIFGYASAGIRIPLGYYSDLRFGPEIYYGLNNINKEDSYIDIFGNNRENKTTLLKKYGLKLSYILKL